MHALFRPRRFASVFLLVLLIGCNSSNEGGEIFGTVTFNGKKVTAGTVVFATEDGSLLMPAPIDLDGNYRLQNPPVGKMRVSVETLMYKDTKPLVGRIKPGKDTPINSAASPMMNVPKYVHIPEKYEKHDTSGLTYDVKRGKFEWNIELE